MATNAGEFVINITSGHNLRLWGLICAENAEIEGMRAENQQREIQGDSMAYTARDFGDVANEIRRLAEQVEPTP